MISLACIYCFTPSWGEMRRCQVGPRCQGPRGGGGVNTACSLLFREVIQTQSLTLLVPRLYQYGGQTVGKRYHLKITCFSRHAFIVILQRGAHLGTNQYLFTHFILALRELTFNSTSIAHCPWITNNPCATWPPRILHPCPPAHINPHVPG